MVNEYEPITSPLPLAMPRERKKAKSPGRVAAAKRLNELGLRGPGGRPPVHGIRALEALLARGQAPEGMIGRLLAAYEQEALEDRENPTSRARGAARRIAEYELYIGLVKARLITQAGGPRRLPWAKEKDLITTGAALAEKYLKAAELLGIDARVKDVLDPFRAEMLRQEMEAEREERERQRADAAEVQDGPPERPGGSQVDDLGNRAMHIPVDCDDGDGDHRVES